MIEHSVYKYIIRIYIASYTINLIPLNFISLIKIQDIDECMNNKVRISNHL